MFPIVYPEPLIEQAVAGGVYLVCILALFTVLGVPLYLASRILRLSPTVPGLICGFSLGMMGSLGYASMVSLHNFLLALCTFGVSGLVSAGLFLRCVEGSLGGTPG